MSLIQEQETYRFETILPNRKLDNDKNHGLDNM